jgi:trk system potassium uptake protein TrkA
MTDKLTVVVAGAGRVGATAIHRLAEQGHDVLAIERDTDRCERLADRYVSTIIEGDAADPAILEQAGIEDADVVGALTGETGTNLAVCLAAEKLDPAVRTVARVDRPAGGDYERFVDAAVFPEQAGGRIAANAMIGGDVHSFAEAPGDLELVYVRVAEGAPAADKRLEDVQFPAGALVISGEDGNHVAAGETTLTPGERYIVAVEPGVADEVLNLLRS